MVNRRQQHVTTIVCAWADCPRRGAPFEVPGWKLPRYCSAACHMAANRAGQINHNRVRIRRERSEAPTHAEGAWAALKSAYNALPGGVAVTGPTDLCVYCGWDAESTDHLRPHTWTGEAARQYVETVPACLDCNARIGDRCGPDIAHRKAVAYESLSRKYRALLATPSWSDDELAEFGRHLRDALESREAMRRIIRYRLDNLARDEGAPLTDWFEHMAAYGDRLAAVLVEMRKDGSSCQGNR